MRKLPYAEGSRLMHFSTVGMRQPGVLGRMTFVFFWALEGTFVNAS